MKVLTYKSYKEHDELHTGIHDLFAVNDCLSVLPRKGIVLLLNIAVIFYKAGSRKSVANNNFIKFTLSAGTYSFHDFSAKRREQFYKKGKIRNRLELKTSNWSYQNITDLWHLIPFYRAWYTRQLS